MRTLGGQPTQKTAETRRFKPTHQAFTKEFVFTSRYRNGLRKLELMQKTKHLGYFTNEREAAETYNAAAAEHYGDFAKLNTFDD